MIAVATVVIPVHLFVGGPIRVHSAGSFLESLSLSLSVLLPTDCPVKMGQASLPLSSSPFRTKECEFLSSAESRKADGGEA